jgi:hypothetical protein
MAKIKEYNNKLIKRFDILNKFSTNEIDILTRYIGPGSRNKPYNFFDIQQYLIDGRVFVTPSNSYNPNYKTAEEVCSDVKRILNNKEDLIKKYIMDMNDIVITRQLHIRYNLYRCMDISYVGNTINTFSSWSLIPLQSFCETGKDVHIYQITGGCKGLYIEINEKNDKWMSRYEYEVILPPGVQFIPIKTETINMLSNSYIYDKSHNTKSTNSVITVHYIKINNSIP